MAKELPPSTFKENVSAAAAVAFLAFALLSIPRENPQTPKIELGFKLPDAGIIFDRPKPPKTP